MSFNDTIIIEQGAECAAAMSGELLCIIVFLNASKV
jgi:hypothetical protein